MTYKKKCRNYYLVFFLFVLRYVPLAKNISRRFRRFPALVGFPPFALGAGCWLVLFIVPSFIIGQRNDIASRF